jgi:hypothetical protein
MREDVTDILIRYRKPLAVSRELAEGAPAPIVNNNDFERPSSH